MRNMQIEIQFQSPAYVKLSHVRGKLAISERGKL